jgi:hypothetical protein
MDVASFCPLPVGVLAWHAPWPVTTVIVKATFSLDEDGAAVLAADQEPLCVGRRLVDSDTELHCSSDFAPIKKAVDVLAVGHAWAAKPCLVVPFTLSVGPMVARLEARSDRPARGHPLLSRHLAEQGAGTPGSVRLAPAVQELRAWGDRTVTRGFDFTCFNTAPAEHRVRDSVAGQRLVLDGLLADTPRREVELPRQPPCLFHVPNRDKEAFGLGEKVLLACDTLWVDTDRRVFTMTWRGVAPRPRGELDRPFLAVALPGSGKGPSWAELATRLGDAEWYPAATEDSSPRLQSVRLIPAQATSAGASPQVWQQSGADQESTTVLDIEEAPREHPSPRLEATAGASPELQDDDTVSDEPSSVPPPIDSVTANVQPENWDKEVDDETTEGLVEDDPDLDDTEELAPITARAGVRLGELGGFALGGAVLARSQADTLPFSPADSEVRLPSTAVPGSEEATTTRRPGHTRNLNADAQLAAALQRTTPFGAKQPPVPASPTGTLDPEESSLDLDGPTVTSIDFVLPNEPALPFARPGEDGGTSATAAKRSAVPMPPVERYAAVKAALRHQDRPTDDVLAEHGFDETGWRSIERRQALAIARDAATGGRLAVEIREAIAAARNQLAHDSSELDLSLEDFAKLRVAVDDADDPSLALGKRGLSAADWDWLQRTWAHRTKADGRVAAELRRKLAAARLQRDNDDST